MNSPIKYFGGKGMMQNQILKYFPSHIGYLEPFGGSGAMLFSKNPSDIEIYNDINQNVYSLFYVLSNKERFARFRDKCELSYFHEQLRQEAKDKLKTELSLEDRAYYYFIFNRLSTHGTGGFYQNIAVRRNLSKSVSDFLSSIDRLPEIHSRVSNLLVYNRNALELMIDYDREGFFFYLDPPYHWSTRTSARYECDLSDTEQIKFIDTCLTLKHAKVLISAYECKEYNELLKNGFYKEQFEVNTINPQKESKKKLETLYMNYQIQESLFN